MAIAWPVQHRHHVHDSVKTMALNMAAVKPVPARAVTASQATPDRQQLEGAIKCQTRPKFRDAKMWKNALEPQQQQQQTLRQHHEEAAILCVLHTLYYENLEGHSRWENWGQGRGR